MTATADPVAVAINDARALLDAMLAGSWQDLHVISGGTEIFLARPAGGANPMRAPIATVEPAVDAPLGAESVVKAPHVATFCSAAAVGSAVAAGEQVATLSVLDDEFPVLAPVAGTIEQVVADPGSLLEFDQPILLLRENA